MIKAIADLFRKRDGNLDLTMLDSIGDDQLVTAALLIEVMISDGCKHKRELDMLTATLAKQFLLTNEQAGLLVDQAMREVDRSTSLFQFTAIVNKIFSAPEKERLIERLWQLALVDGHIDKLEEATIRKVAELIHVPHSRFIRARHIARNC